MTDEDRTGGKRFEGYHLTEDDQVEQALEEYKAADEKYWELTNKYLYPPEEVPFEGKRELVFPSVQSREEYFEIKRLAQEARERYEQIARDRQMKGGADQ